MAKRLNCEEAKHFIEVESGSGCKLLSNEYKNNRTKLKINGKVERSSIFFINL